MSATPEDVQTKISQAQALLAAASVEVGQLVAPSAPTPTPPTPTPPSGAVAQPVPPAFVVKRTLPAAVTWAEVQAGVNALQPGDRLPVKGVIFPASPTFTKALSAAAEIAFDAACKLQGGGKQSPAFRLNGAAFLRFIAAPGLVVSNPSWSGMQLSAAHDCVLDGWTLNNVATTGIDGFPTAGDIANNYIRVKINNFSQNISLDPHAEKGTGFHGMNMADCAQPHYARNNVVVLSTEGSRYGGSLLEYGQPGGQWAPFAPYGNKVWLDAKNLLFDAQSQAGGNALNLWGTISGIDVLWIGASGLHGYAVASSPGSFKATKIEAGEAVNCCLNPRYKGKNPWQKTGGIVYAPGPFTPTP